MPADGLALGAAKQKLTALRSLLAERDLEWTLRQDRANQLWSEMSESSSISTRQTDDDTGCEGGSVRPVSVRPAEIPTNQRKTFSGALRYLPDKDQSIK